MNRKIITAILISSGIIAQEINNWGPFYREYKNAEFIEKRAVAAFFVNKKYFFINDDFSAIRPFVCKFESNEPYSKNYDYLWPFGETRSHANSIRTRLFFLFGTTKKEFIENSTFMTNNYQSYWMFPLIWWKKEKDAKDFSGMFFPFYGKMHNDWTYKKLDFMFFPIFGSGEKEHWYSHNILWPIYNKTTGEKINRWRFFPFYAYSQKDGVFAQNTILWPFWHQRWSLNPDQQSESVFFFPFYGKGYSLDKKLKKESTQKTILFPFYRNYQVNYLENSQKNQYSFNVWPFYRHDENIIAQKSKTKNYWPIYGETIYPNFEGYFYAWPFMHNWKYFDKEKKLKTATNYFIPFYYDSKNYEKENLEKQDFLLWPLARKIQKNGEVTTSFPSIFPYPFDVYDRNYAPIFTLYSSWKNENNESWNEILWGLWFSAKSNDYVHRSLFPLIEYERRNHEQKVEFLKGLFGIKKENGKRKFKLFWFFEF